jgi:hypothetical protein
MTDGAFRAMRRCAYLWVFVFQNQLDGRQNRVSPRRSCRFVFHRFSSERPPVFSNPITTKDQAMMIIANTPSNAVTDGVLAAGYQGSEVDASLILDGTGGVFVQPNANVKGYWLDESQLVKLAIYISAR